MKSIAAGCLLGLFVVATALSLRGQDPHAVNLPQSPDYAAARTGIGSTSKNSSGIAPSGTPDEEKNTDPNDSSLYRGKTSESDNPMLRDEGPLHFKTHPKEKTHDVDLRNLQKGGTDPKFQGSFLNSGASSIDKVAEKGIDELAVPEGGRFSDKHLNFTPQTDNQPKNKTRSDSTPSPTPSPSASPTTKNSNKPKQ